MMRRHLSDAQLIEGTIGAATGAHVDHVGAHVEHCAQCRTRRDALRALLADTADAATADAEAAFPDERLTRQRQRIMERVEQLSRAGRVISFPTAFGRVSPSSAANRTRWVAAAAAAGLVVGLLGGHLTHDLRVQPGGIVAGRAPAGGGRAAIVPAVQTEDDLLGQVEVAFEASGPSALRPLDALTPVAWDVRE